MKRHDNRVVIVTGAASGIGEATARAFAAEGAKVVLADIAVDAGRKIVDDIRATGGVASFLRTDATQEADAEALVAHAITEFGRLDAAINNIGNIAPGQPFDENLHEATLDHWRRTVDLNLTSCFVGMKHQIRQFLRQGQGGAIANTASMAGIRYAAESVGSYVAAKAGVVKLSEYAAVKYAADGIRVNIVAPGLTATPKVRQTFSEEQRREMAARTQPMGRMMRPEELADAFLWLCSDQASGVTGLTIPVSGGWAAT